MAADRDEASSELVCLQFSVSGLAERLVSLGRRLVREDELDARSRQHVVVMLTSGLPSVSAAMMNQLPAFHRIVAIAAGREGIDIEAAKARGIEVVGPAGANADDVADFAVMR